jgi:hypothetical protein
MRAALGRIRARMPSAAVSAKIESAPAGRRSVLDLYAAMYCEVVTRAREYGPRPVAQSGSATTSGSPQPVHRRLQAQRLTCPNGRLVGRRPRAGPVVGV